MSFRRIRIKRVQWDHPKIEFFEFLDFEYRELVFARVRRWGCFLDDAVACEVWGGVLLLFWRKGWNYRYFSSVEDLRSMVFRVAWCRFRTIRRYRGLRFRERHCLGEWRFSLARYSEMTVEDDERDGLFEDCGERLVFKSGAAVFGVGLVGEAYRALTPEQRDVVDLVLVREFRPGEAAVMLGVSKQVVDARLKRVYSLLRAQLVSLAGPDWVPPVEKPSCSKRCPVHRLQFRDGVCVWGPVVSGGGEA